MNEMTSLLGKLNFTKTEAEVYITLLKYPNLTGYQVAKKMSMSRSSVYSALDNLYNRGAVSLLQGETSVYVAQDPEMLIDSMKKDFNQSADLLKIELSKIGTTDTEKRYLNIEGFENIIVKTKELLMMAEQEVYINTDFDLQIFSKELKELGQKGVRIIAFSFSALDVDGLPVEMYSHGIEAKECGFDTRMMLVVDYKKTLIASSEDCDKFVGTFTDNRLLASIVAEHIHHDIYLQKLKLKYGKDLFDESIMMNTLMEQGDCNG